MLLNVTVQLDRVAQRHPCSNTPRGRGDRTGDINVPESAEVAAFYRKQRIWERVGDIWHSKAGERCTERVPAVFACQVQTLQIRGGKWKMYSKY